MRTKLDYLKSIYKNILFHIECKNDDDETVTVKSFTEFEKMNEYLNENYLTFEEISFLNAVTADAEYITVDSDRSMSFYDSGKQFLFHVKVKPHMFNGLSDRSWEYISIKDLLQLERVD